MFEREMLYELLTELFIKLCITQFKYSVMKKKKNDSNKAPEK